MITVYIDGGARNNPGEAAIGMVVYDGNGKELLRVGRRIGVATNNKAEYTALVEALRFIDKSFRSEESLIYTDSELVVRQMQGIYRVKSPSITPLYNKAQQLKEKLPQIRLTHIRRNRNKTADWIVNRVLDNKPFAEEGVQGRNSAEY